LSWWFSFKNQPKKPNQNGQVQNNLSRMALLPNWTKGQKNHMGGFLLLEFLVKKVVISYNVSHTIFDNETLNFTTS